MAATPSFRQAPDEYNAMSENLFRRELENILVIALAVANNIATAESSIASHTHKRHLSTMPPLGLSGI